MARKRDGMPFPRVPTIELLNPFSQPKFSLNRAISIFGILHPMHSTTYPTEGTFLADSPYIFFFFLYFNEFLFCYVLHFFYTLTYEHVGKIQKNGKEN